MADPQGTVFGDKAVKQIAKTVREVARRMMNEKPNRGRWQFHGGSGGGGGGHTIWFTIDSLLCPEADYVAETTLVVTATHYNQSCAGTPPGANYEGTYDVYDICNYLHGLVEDDLLGTTGRATYMYPLTGACEPRWVIDDLCAQPEC
jgi:hypothetical protein